MAEQFSLSTFFAALLAIAGGLYIAYLDLISIKEEIVTLAMFATLGFVTTFLDPKRVWLWPMLSAACLPLLNYFPEWVRASPNPGLPRTFLSYLLLFTVLSIAGSAGAVLAALFRRVPRSA